MAHRKVLVVDDDRNSLHTIALTLNDAQLPFTQVDSNSSAWTAFQADADYSLIVVRAFGGNILGTDLCREIRQVKAHSELPIMIMLREDELVKGAEALLAGASDLLIDPFEPRELRMRANIVAGDQVLRVDSAHTLAAENSSIAKEPEFFVPEFDANTKKLSFGQHEHKRRHWETDPDVRKIALDKVIVCPECEAIPTFRPGCGACGSAWTEQEVLIHHYACAHVGPEQEFITSDGLVCPKCRLRDLVAGSDFEQIKGCQRCTDCEAIFTEANMIGHCLSCEHRFAATEGKVKAIHGYEVGRSPQAATISAPSYHTTVVTGTAARGTTGQHPV